MKRIVKTISIANPGIVGNNVADLLIIEQYLQPDVTILNNVNHFDFKLPRQPLIIRESVIKRVGGGIGLGDPPTSSALGQVCLSDVFQIKPELARHVGNIPEQITQFFGHTLREKLMSRSVAQMLLVLAQQLTSLSSQSE